MGRSGTSQGPQRAINRHLVLSLNPHAGPVLISLAGSPYMPTRMFSNSTNRTTQSEQYARVQTFVRNATQVIECHHISGSESFLLRVISSSVSHLDGLIEELSAFGGTKTSIVLSSSVKKRAIEIDI